jgi:hypothetical protein
MTRTNLMPHPSSETALSLWVPQDSSCTGAFSSTLAYVGSQSLAITKDGTTGNTAITYGIHALTGVPDAQAIPVTAGQTYTFSYWGRTATASITSRINLFWATDTDLISTSGGGNVVLATNTWTRRSVTAVAPVGATKVGLHVGMNAMAAGAIVYIDAILLEKSDTLGNYFDGDTADTADSTYAWTGTFHESTSTELVTRGTGRINPIKNPSFETDLTGYTSQQSTTQTRDTGEFVYGTASLKCVVTGAARIAVYGATGGAVGNADAIAVTPGELVTFSAYVKPNNSALLRVIISWFNSSGTWMANADGTLAAQTADVWSRLAVTGVAPAGAAKYGVCLYSNNATTVYTDGWLAEKSPIADVYFDGDTTDAAYIHSWTGTAHASTSRAVAAGVRTNLLTNPSSETGSAGWDTMTAATRQSTIPANVYAGMYRWGFIASGAEKTSKVPATAGLAYTASAWMARTQNPAQSGAVSVHFFDGGGTELDAPTTTLTSFTTRDVLERRASTRIAPTGTTQAAVWTHGDGANVSFDAVMLEESAYLDSYFDGSTKSNTFTHAWTGTAHASSSTQTAGAPTDGTLVTVKNRESGLWVARTSVPRARVAGVWKVGNPKRWNGSAWVDLA